MAHVLVVGGTGMLKDVSLFLAQHENTVSVVARNQERLDTLTEEAKELKGRINPLRIDYRNINDFQSKIETSIKKYGPIILVVNWMESSALESSDLIAELLNVTSPICRYFQVLSTSGEQLAEERYFVNPYGDLARILYRTVTLGYKVEDGGLSRLLNPQEVCDGVIDAIRNDRRNAVVGSTKVLAVRSQTA